MVKLSIILPVYNEEENVPVIYEELKSVLDKINKNYEIIFIDDGSTDKTFEVLEKLHKKNPKVKIIKFRKNFGQSAALQAGFDNCRGEIVVSMDSDLQNNPRDIPKLIEKLDEGYDCVCGWRHKREDSFSKKVLSKIASLMRRPLIGTDLHDFGCTFRVYKKDCVKELELYGEMHRYIPPMLRWKGFRVSEMEVNHRKRLHGKTKYNCKRVMKGFVDMINVWFWQKYSQRPLHIFGGLGLVCSSIGFFVGFLAFYWRLFKGVDLSSTPLPLFAVFMVMIGIQFFISGLMADISIKNYYSSGKRKTYNIEKILE